MTNLWSAGPIKGETHLEASHERQTKLRLKENGKNCPLSKREFSNAVSPGGSASPAPWHPNSFQRDLNREVAPTPLPEMGCQHMPIVWLAHCQVQSSVLPGGVNSLEEGHRKINSEAPKLSGELLIILQHQDKPGNVYQIRSQAVRQVSCVSFKGWTGVSQRAAILIQTRFFKTGLWEGNSLVEMTSPVSRLWPYHLQGVKEGATAQFAEWAPGGQACVLSLLTSQLLNKVFNTGVMDRWMDNWGNQHINKWILYNPSLEVKRLSKTK